MKKKNNIFLIIVILFLFFNITLAQSVWFVDPTNGETITYTAFGATETTIPVNCNYNHTNSNNPNMMQDKFKLITHDKTYWSNVDDGIPQWFYLIPGAYTWRIELWEYYLGQGYYKVAEETITFYVRHSLKVRNNFNEGSSNIKIDGLTKTSGANAIKSPGDNLAVGAIDQIYGGTFYVWKTSGTNKSRWGRKGRNSNTYTTKSYSKNYNYQVQSNDNGATIQGELRIDDVPPAAPQGLTKSWANGGEEDGNPRIDWNANTEVDLDHYEVWKKIDNWSEPDINWFVKATTTSNYYIDYDEQGWGTFGPPRDVYYKLKAVDVNNNKSTFSSTVIFKCEQDLNKKNQNLFVSNKPNENKLVSNYPNPFNPTTTINYQLKESGFVTLKVFDVLGKKVAELVNENKSAGFYNVNFDAGNLPSGLYFYRMTVNDYVETKKMLLTK